MGHFFSYHPSPIFVTAPSVPTGHTTIPSDPTAPAVATDDGFVGNRSVRAAWRLRVLVQLPRGGVRRDEHFSGPIQQQSGVRGDIFKPCDAGSPFLQHRIVLRQSDCERRAVQGHGWARRRDRFVVELVVGPFGRGWRFQDLPCAEGTLAVGTPIAVAAASPTLATTITTSPVAAAVPTLAATVTTSAGAAADPTLATTITTSAAATSPPCAASVAPSPPALPPMRGCVGAGRGLRRYDVRGASRPADCER